MNLSIWRYSHLVLAIVTSCFLVVVSLTGIILAVEPILDKSQSFYVKDSDTLSLGQTVAVVTEKYEEVLGLKRDKNGFVLLETTEETFYIDPFTGNKLGEPQEKKELFKFATSLHRSLFLNSLGRAFIGATSFLLLFILLSGVVLILKRQQGLKHFFAKIIKDSPAQYYHVVLGRFTLVPLLLLSITGTYLFLERFKVIPEHKIELLVDYDTLKETDQLDPSEFTVFKQVSLANLRELVFPVFEDIEEFYHLKTKKKELYINQFSGQVESEQAYPFTALASRLSFNLHTGQGSVLWSLALGFSMLAIPYFIYSGFVLTINRRKGRIKNVYAKDESEFVILVGSENGSTRLFAKMLHQGLLKEGRTSYITEMNRYTKFDQMQHLVLLTSTYGQGEPPANANNFLKLLGQVQAARAVKYAVVGFGSMSYPDYCQFAFDVDKFLETAKEYHKLMEVHTVNNKSFESFSNWVSQWSDKIGASIQLPKEGVVVKRKKTQSFKLRYKTIAKENPDDTFLMELQPPKKQNFRSGDLLAIYPAGDATERLYSMAKVDKSILLSVKRHQNGLCSNYLNHLKVGESLEGYIIKNQKFHLPKKAKKVVMIATGTGIAPYLGMLSNPTKQILELYWGAKTQASLGLYKTIINQALKDNRLNKFAPAYSREGSAKIYVQHLIKRDVKGLMQDLEQKTVIMICGSIAMQQEVMAILTQYSQEINQRPLSHYTNNGQILMDCY